MISTSIQFGLARVKTEKQQVTNQILTPANMLSALRLLLLPLFCVLLAVYNQNGWAFLVLFIAALTDLLDGQLARFTNTVSKLGIQLDPAVDRIFILVAVITIYAVGRLPLWLLLSFMSRDALLLLVTIYQKRRFNRDFEVIFLGKLTTAAAMAGFCSLVLLWPMIPGLQLIELDWLPGLGAANAPLGYIVLYLAMICSWISALYYLIRGLTPPRSEPDTINASDLATTDCLNESDVQITGDV